MLPSARLAACGEAAAFVAEVRRLLQGDDDAAAGAGVSPAARTFLHLFDLSASAPPLRLARVPGRLDVLGGVTDIFGGLSLQAVTEEGTLVISQARADGQGALRVVSLMPGGGDEGGPALTTTTTLAATLTLSALVSDDKSLASVRAALATEPPWVRYVGGAVAAIAAAHPAGARAVLCTQPISSSLTLLISSCVPPGAGLASSASLCVSVAAATAAALAGEGGPAALPLPARRALARAAPAAAWAAEALVAGAPCGPADQAAVWAGSGGALLPVDCGRGGRGGATGLLATLPVTTGAPLPLPHGWAAVALRSGALHSVGGHDTPASAAAPSPYHAARAAGFLAARLLEKEAGPPPGGAPAHFLCAWGRPGATPPPALASLPLTLTGRAAASASASTADPATSPLSHTHPYPVLAAAQHAVGDAARAWRARAALEGSSSSSGGARAAAVAALGAAMATSHAGYGRVGLGHPATDALVATLTSRPPTLVAGARASGGGAGGAVVALVADSEEGRAAVAAAAAAAGAGAAHWAAPAGALGGAGFGVLTLTLPGLEVVDSPDDWGGL